MHWKNEKSGTYGTEFGYLSELLKYYIRFMNY